MQDLQGPRIRVGKLPTEGIELKDGQVYQFSYASSGKSSDKIIAISDKYLHVDIQKGDPFFLASGELELRVEAVKRGVIFARVERGGILFSNKGINVPQTKMRAGGLTPKDIKDVRFALKQKVDYIALSFVQGPEDILKLRKVIGKAPVKIIAKIERALALRYIDEIIQASDGIMVARGDLGVEMPMSELPIIQKNIIRHAHWHTKPAILATQIMTSMITHHHPTRAEVSDIANGIFDGADALMLSDETAAGQYPVRAVEMMKKIIVRIENYINADNLLT
jgi:pyruvate kinase